MSFTIRVIVSDKELGPTLAKLKSMKGVEIVHKADEVINGTPKQKAKGFRAKKDTRLTMTGKTPTAQGTKLSAALAVFEQMEAEQGIGSISVGALRDKLGNRSLPTRLVTEGYMAYL